MNSYEEVLEIIKEAEEAEARELDLAGRDITELPPEIGKLKNLRILVLSFNRLTKLPSEIGKLVNLQELDVRANKLVILPSEIGELVKLQNLYLSNNELITLTPEIGKLKSLRGLDLRGNEITVLPPEIGYLTELRGVKLSDNELSDLPGEIEKLTELRGLDLRGNEITVFPPEIMKLSGLENLNLSGNHLTEVPSGMGKLTGLKKLHLYGNKLVSIPSQIGNLSALKELDLGRNKLTTLPPEIGRLKELKVLDAGGNELTALPSDIKKLTGLQKLNLSNNHLSYLPRETGELIGLEILDLYDNKLTVLPPEIVKLINLKVLNLYDNPLEIPANILSEKPRKIINYYFNRGCEEKKEILSPEEFALLVFIGDGLCELPEKPGEPLIITDIRAYIWPTVITLLLDFYPELEKEDFLNGWHSALKTNIDEIKNLYDNHNYSFKNYFYQENKSTIYESVINSFLNSFKEKIPSSDIDLNKILEVTEAGLKKLMEKGLIEFSLEFPLLGAAASISLLECIPRGFIRKTASGKAIYQKTITAFLDYEMENKAANKKKEFYFKLLRILKFFRTLIFFGLKASLKSTETSWFKLVTME